MDQIARKWILESFKNATGKPRIGSMYIDLQSIYTKTADAAAAAERNKTFAEQARKHNIRNIWIGMAFTKMAWQKYTPTEFMTSPSQERVDLFDIAKPQHGEFIYTKNEHGAFAKPGPLHEDTQDLELLFAGGLNAMACLPTSIIGALRSTNAKIIAFKDATNGKAGISKEEYKEAILSFADAKEREKFSKRLVVCNTDLAISVLMEANPQPAAQHHKPHQQLLQPPPRHHLPPSHE